MALKKTKNLPNGYSGEYWKISAENYDRITKRCTWQIALFKDQAASAAGKAHLGIVKNFSKVLTAEEVSQRTTIGYAAIRNQAERMVTPFGEGEEIVFDPDLADAEDV